MSDSEDEVVNKQIKIVFLGDISVGKTSIIKRFCYDEFSRQYNPTVGADFYIKRKILNGQNETVLKISDIGGQEDKMLDKYLFDVDIVVLVYDITNLSSFESLSKWLSRLKSRNEKISAAIVGNKCDMEHQRAVRLDRTRQFVEQNELMGHTAVSARTGEAVGPCILGRGRYNPTVGADFYIKRKILNGQNETVLKISDIGGQEDKMLDKYLFDVDIVVLVYDITNLSSFESLSKWLSRLKSRNEKISAAIVGNKCDMEHQRAVRLDRTRQFVEQNELMGHTAVSARTGEAVGPCILVAKFFGVPLARTDQEQRVVKAELADAAIRAPYRYPTGGPHRKSPSSTGICILQ